MRIFEKFLDNKIYGEKDNYIFIDLAYAENTRGCLEITLGIKENVGGMIGTIWKSMQILVEDNFSISEFINTCGKFKIQCSAFCGDDKTYVLQ